MNCNLKKALLLVGIFASFATKASADGWVAYCLNPTSTSSPYSTDFGTESQWDTLFGAACGVTGTINYMECFGNPGVTLPVAGRLGFTVGTQGSTQDNLQGNIIDDELMLIPGMQWFGALSLPGFGITPSANDILGNGPAGNWSIAKVFVGTPTGTTTTGSYFGQNAISLAYFGASDRYFVLQSTNSNILITLRVDILGDAARCDWKFQNTQTTAATVGFWFGQWVLPFEAMQGPHPADYVTAPGYKPMSVDTTFAAANAVLNTQSLLTPLPMPAYVNFGLSQTNAYGLQVVLQQSAQMPDQTSASSIDIGKNGWLLGSMTASDGAMPDAQYPDTSFGFGNDAYIEKWDPIAIGAAGSGTETREIVAYYRGTWSTSDYVKPYSVVLDAPAVIGTAQGNPSSFSNAPFFLTVNVDNTRGFSTVDQGVPLQDVQVTVSLPSGMSQFGNPNVQRMTQYISSIAPATIGQAVFKVDVDPTLYGAQQYTVTVTPNPGQQKTLTGTIVVGSQPFLQIGTNANLVSAPWQFSDSTWNTIIGTNSGLTLDTDYQVFGWDPVAQSYILQTGPQRGFGSFLISNVNAGFVNLGGAPQQVNDLQAGAPQIICQPGWNMIANPYNYAIPIGQLVGVPESDNQNSYTWQQLTNQNIVSGVLAFWDPLSASYKYTQTTSDMIQPNTGYWLYVQSQQSLVLDFPPVFQAFLPGIPDLGFAATKNSASSVEQPKWVLPLVAQANGMVDAQSAVGQTATAALAKTLTRFKPPVSPLKNAVWTSFPAQSSKRTLQLATALTASGVGSQTWDWQVYTASAVPVTITWPAISTVPNNVQIKLIDTVTGTQKTLRHDSSYTFAGKTRSTHAFKVVVTTGAAIPVITSETASAGTSSLTGTYALSVNATTTIQITQNNKVVATLASNRPDVEGKNTVSWNYLDAANRQVPSGTYQLVVKSTPSGGATETKTVAFSVKGPVITAMSTNAASTLSGSYTLSVNARSTVSILQNGKLVTTVVNNRNDSVGQKGITWDYTNASGKKVPAGVYEFVVKSIPASGVAETKFVLFKVH